MFKSEQEQHYFRFFCDKIVTQLSGLFESVLWSQVVLQASESESSIRQILVAMGAGALGLNSEGMTTRLPLIHEAPEICREERERHHCHALQRKYLTSRQVSSNVLRGPSQEA
jgi:hypothetical protein